MNFGDKVPSRKERYEKAHEFIQIVQGLWGSWEEDACCLMLKMVNLLIWTKLNRLTWLEITSSQEDLYQFRLQSKVNLLFLQQEDPKKHLKFLDAMQMVFIQTRMIWKTASVYRKIFREGAKKFGRDPNEIKVFPGIIPSIAPTKEEALERRRQLDRNGDLRGRVQYLGSMIGVPLSYEQIDQPVPEQMLKHAFANPHDPRSPRALELVKTGMTIRDVLAHGVINYHPVIVGTAEDVADFMEEWFVNGACDGFAIQPDVSFDGIRDFVDQVIPILQERGLFHEDYEGITLREHMGISYQYGMME